MELSLSQWMVIGVCAALILGYLGGYYYNRRQAARILDWLHPALAKWGTVQAGGRLPGMISGGQLLVPNASAPFRRIEATYILAPRENLFFWLFHRLQGRSDELILKISLSQAPKAGGEAKRRGRSGFAYQGRNTEEKWAEFMSRYGRAVFHLTLRREAPHLLARLNLPELMTKEGDVFTSLGSLLS